MKILIITTPQELGGGEIYVKNIVKSLPQHQFLVLTSLQKFVAQLKSESINTHNLILGVKFLSRFHVILFLLLAPINIVQFLFYLLIFNPDIIHIQSQEEQILVTPISRLLGKKVIWTLHGPIEKGNRVVDWMFLKTSQLVNKIIAISDFVKRSMDIYGIKTQTTVIHHGVDLKKFKPATTKTNKKIIGYVGRLVDIKRPELFLNVAIYILRRFTNAQAWIVGEGRIEKKMESIASTLADNRIKFLGFREDVDKIIKNFTILLITSETEGLNVSALEAIASGVPVASVKVGALSEVVNDETGILIDSNDPREIADKVIAVIQDDNLLAKLKKSCRKVAERSFSLDRMISETNLVYTT